MSGPLRAHIEYRWSQSTHSMPSNNSVHPVWMIRLRQPHLTTTHSMTSCRVAHNALSHAKHIGICTLAVGTLGNVGTFCRASKSAHRPGGPPCRCHHAAPARDSNAYHTSGSRVQSHKVSKSSEGPNSLRIFWAFVVSTRNDITRFQSSQREILRHVLDDIE